MVMITRYVKHEGGKLAFILEVCFSEKNKMKLQNETLKFLRWMFVEGRLRLSRNYESAFVIPMLAREGKLEFFIGVHLLQDSNV